MADIGLDDFLAELEGTSSSTPAKTPAQSGSAGVGSSAGGATAGTSSVNSSILDDDLADIFGVDVSATPSKFAPATLEKAGADSTNTPLAIASAEPAKDDGDIMSWLGDSPGKSSSETKSAAKQPAVPATVDNFFDEVFGDSAAPLSPISTKSFSLDVQAEIFDAVHSSFPDVVQIRKLIYQAGYVPPQLRGLIWCLLMTGATNEDHEADYYHPTGAELADSSRLNADVDALITRMTSVSGLDLVQCRQDLHDILVLYCVRRQVEYSPLYCSLLAPLVVTTRGSMPRSLASSCFYSLATEFIPIMNLKVSDDKFVKNSLLFWGCQAGAKEMSVEVTHSWLRILVGYHSPKVAQHLDRVLLGWELPSTEAFGSVEVSC
jgi:hypothetical protein